MERRHFLGFTLAAAGTVFVPNYGRWFREGSGLRFGRTMYVSDTAGLLAAVADASVNDIVVRQGAVIDVSAPMNARTAGGEATHWAAGFLTPRPRDADPLTIRGEGALEWSPTRCSVVVRGMHITNPTGSGASAILTPRHPEADYKPHAYAHVTTENDLPRERWVQIDMVTQSDYDLAAESRPWRIPRCH